MPPNSYLGWFRAFVRPIVSGVYRPEDSHPELVSLNGLALCFQARYLLRLTKPTGMVHFRIIVPVEVLSGRFNVFGTI